MEQIKKVAIINDLSGIGRCSLTAAIPILSALGVQSCPFPTAILSNQTEFDSFTFFDLTNEMINYKNGLYKLGINFDCIYSGFLGSENQIDIVLDFAKENKKSLIVVDPVMGDNGIIYDTFNNKMYLKMRELISIADIITPNLTEACLLTEEEYKKYDTTDEKVEYMARKIANMGPKKVIITGIIRGDKIYNFAYDKESDKFFKVSTSYNNESYSGTGDIFTSIIIGFLLNNHDLNFAIENASNYICKVIKYTSKFKTNPKEGIMFERFLKELILLNEY